MTTTLSKPILDATCGSRMIWFNKENPCAQYIDIREIPEMTLCDGRTFKVLPDVIADFTHLPYPDNAFKLVVFDPPHLLRAGETAWITLKYGKLDSGWPQMIHDGFQECMRVLDDYGTLIFKWSEVQISTRSVIEAIGTKPLFGHISGKRSNTHWMTFMKFPEEIPQ